ncbi:aa3-type cytochrome c oxidase subunit IV [Thalassospira alkalitolerans]|nr:aa3-type cytochrome c oxidase subunit IV [Thalassospira alkalitolerans]
MQGKDYELTNTHVDIYNGFTVFMKWGTLSVIGVLILMAIFLL